jgi:uncharacterized protein
MNYIIKTIQGCNLSCIYCYEQSHNRVNLAMRFDDATRFIQKVADYYLRNNPEEILAFHWHGGEPMLMGAEFFEQIIDFQTRVLGAGLRWYNTMQSNLTLLDDAFIELLQKYRGCLNLGISFDFFGDDRVDASNRNVNARVWRNVRRLQRAGIHTTFLTTLTKGNVEHLDEIYDLLRFQNVSIQFNQVFGAPKKRPFNRPSVRLRNVQFSAALQRITRKWLDDGEARLTVNNAERVMRKIVDPTSTRMCWYEKNCLECHMAICADGTVFPCDSFYVKECSYGNILHDPYERILSSKPRKRLLDEQRRAQRECGGCEFADYCNGGCPTRSIFSMPRTHLRLSRDPLCAMHHGLFETIGQHLSRAGRVRPDWAASHPARR